MRKLIIVSIASLFIISCSANKFKINGKIEGAVNQIVYLEQVLENDFIRVDSTTMEDGKFNFKGTVACPDIYAIVFGKTQDRIVLFLENSEISITGSMDDFENVSIVGSDTHDILLGFNKMVEEKSQPLMDINFQYQSAAEDGILTASLEEELTNQYLAEMKLFTESVKQFVKEHSHSVVSAYITLIHLIEPLELNELKEIASAFPDNIKMSQFVKALNEHIEVEERTSVGQPYINIVLPDQLGQDLELSTFIGENYVLVDFWAGWCLPCRQENPNLVSLYKKYKSKGFDIFGVSFDRSREQWLDAIKSDELQWVQVSDLLGWESPVAKQYGIMSIPSNVLISPDGKIVAKNLKGEELQRKLEELFAK